MSVALFLQISFLYQPNTPDIFVSRTLDRSEQRSGVRLVFRWLPYADSSLRGQLQIQMACAFIDVRVKKG